MKVNNCRICNSSQLFSFFDLGKQPLANSLRDSIDITLKIYSLSLLYCEKCSTVQLDTTVDPKLLFKNYIWVTGTSQVAADHAQFFYDQIIKRMNKSHGTVLEIASNDGTFLKPFKNSHKKIIGVEPATNISKIAEENGIYTINSFFNNELAKKIGTKEKNIDLIFARNVIPHVKEIHSIVEGISTLSNNHTTVAIEFHYAGKIIDELHYDSIYHEHLFYFTIKTLGKIFNMYGLYFFDIFKSPISGGSFVLLFSKQKKELSKSLINFINNENLYKYNDLETWLNFATNSKSHSIELNKIIKKFSKDQKLIGYGASARSSTLLNFCNINNKNIEYIFDLNCLKENKYTPGSNIKIINPKTNINMLAERNLILLAWNFKKEISEFLRDNNFKNKLITPLPNKITLDEF